MTPSEKHTVLLVDDDADLRDILADVISGAGYRVIEAANGMVALRYLRRHPGEPCVVVLDLMMPELDGIGFLGAVASEGLEVRVVVFTASSLPPELPAHAKVLRKPVGVATILAAINEVCGDP